MGFCPLKRERKRFLLPSRLRGVSRCNLSGLARDNELSQMAFSRGHPVHERATQRTERREKRRRHWRRVLVQADLFVQSTSEVNLVS